MKNLTGNQVRGLFLEYFKKNGHMIEPGASLVPHNDPTLLWINAGVAALKKYFDGSEKPNSNRIVNAQKSIRTNDIENVGKTARHHTFFEMLGNFSIGDYFKPEAIHFAWEFLTSEEYIGFDPKKLYITVYSDDTEAYNVWVNECHVDPSHICKTPNNFWQIGEGPCGPDTEIFFDRGIEYDPDNIGEKLFFEELENDRYIEIWNVVFSQYDGKEGIERKFYKELPQRNIDTGCGLERLTAIIQGGETNFDTDLFLPIIREIEKYTKIKYPTEEKMAFRVIADHIRTVTFALADGAMFSNEGRGYVLRRVLRRAVRFGKKLGINESFMYKLVPVVYDIMKDFYPYVGEKVEYIQKLVKAEEERFHATLVDGEKLLLDVISKTKGDTIDGATAFKLYDTYGFPFELTLEIAEESGKLVDKTGFDAEMKEQKLRAKNSREDIASMSSQSKDLLMFEKESKFDGYTKTSNKAKIIGLFVDGCIVDKIDTEGDIIVDDTCFYAEMGGQVADTGIIDNDTSSANVVNVTKAPHKQHLHHIKVTSGIFKLGDTVNLTVDKHKRNIISANHSATHLLQSALVAVIGNHTTQAGSFVNDEYLRFDFTHYEKVTNEQLKDIEQRINIMINEALEVTTELMSIKDAKASGATALFDEKYGELVRVVSMGDVSKELCGGIHVSNTSKIGICKIISEESVGSGVRRITAKTGLNAYNEYLKEEAILNEATELMKIKSSVQLIAKTNQLIEEKTKLEKELAAINNDMLVLKAKELVNEAIQCDNYKVIIKEFSNVEPNSLKSIATNLKAELLDAVIFFAAKNDDKVVFIAGAGSKALEAGIKCGELVKEAAQICEGNGGGRNDLAQAGGKNSAKIGEAMQVIKNKLV
ncbi:MAG: alanine--tRNA ligase [Erysipelotrichaceae bacterium]